MKRCLGWWPVTVLVVGALVSAHPARAATGKLRLSEKRVFAGQAVVLTARGVKLKRAAVTVAGRRARVLARRGARLTLTVPRVRPGVARVVLRAGGRRLVGRLRVVRAVGAARLKVVPEAARAASGVVGAQGAVVSATSSDGTVYELTVPAGAAPMGTAVTVTPARLAGAPVSDRAPLGVVFGPDGQRFSIPATLRIEPAQPRPKALGFTFAADGTRTGLMVPEVDAGGLRFAIDHFSGAGAGTPTEADMVSLLSILLGYPALSFAQVLDAGAIIEEAEELFGGRWCAREPTCVAVRDRTRPVAIAAAGGCAADAAALTTVAVALEGYGADWWELFEYDLVDPLIGAGPQTDAACATQYLIAARKLADGRRFPQDFASPYALRGLEAAAACSDAPFDLDGDGQTTFVECAMLVRLSIALYASGLGPFLAPADRDALQTADSHLREFVQIALSNAIAQAETSLCDRGSFAEGRATLRRIRTLAQIAAARFPADATTDLSARIEQALAGCPKITLSPENPTIEPGATVAFTATSEDPADTHFVFSSSDGRISPVSGEYVAPGEGGPVTVTATSTDHQDRTGTTTLTIGCPAGGRSGAASTCEGTVTVTGRSGGIWNTYSYVNVTSSRPLDCCVVASDPEPNDSKPWEGPVLGTRTVSVTTSIAAERLPVAEAKTTADTEAASTVTVDGEGRLHLGATWSAALDAWVDRNPDPYEETSYTGAARASARSLITDRIQFTVSGTVRIDCTMDPAQAPDLPFAFANGVHRTAGAGARVAVGRTDTSPPQPVFDVGAGPAYSGGADLPQGTYVLQVSADAMAGAENGDPDYGPNHDEQQVAYETAAAVTCDTT